MRRFKLLAAALLLLAPPALATYVPPTNVNGLVTLSSVSGSTGIVATGDGQTLGNLPFSVIASYFSGKTLALTNPGTQRIASGGTSMTVPIVVTVTGYSGSPPTALQQSIGGGAFSNVTCSQTSGTTSSCPVANVPGGLAVSVQIKDPASGALSPAVTFEVDNATIQTQPGTSVHVVGTALSPAGTADVFGPNPTYFALSGSPSTCPATGYVSVTPGLAQPIGALVPSGGGNQYVVGCDGNNGSAHVLTASSAINVTGGTSGAVEASVATANNGADNKIAFDPITTLGVNRILVAVSYGSSASLTESSLPTSTSGLTWAHLGSYPCTTQSQTWFVDWALAPSAVTNEVVTTHYSATGDMKGFVIAIAGAVSTTSPFDTTTTPLAHAENFVAPVISFGSKSVLAFGSKDNAGADTAGGWTNLYSAFYQYFTGAWKIVAGPQTNYPATDGNNPGGSLNQCGVVAAVPVN